MILDLSSAVVVDTVNLCDVLEVGRVDVSEEAWNEVKYIVRCRRLTIGICDLVQIHRGSAFRSLVIANSVKECLEAFVPTVSLGDGAT